MQFQSRIFVRVSNPGARMVELGSVLFFGSLILAGVLSALKISDSYQIWSVCLFILGILSMIVGRIIAKGNMFTIGLSDTDLVVAEDGVRVGNEFYPMDEITDLDFMIEGYDGAPTVMRGRGYLRKPGRLSGANNKIHFRARGQRHIYQFYLSDRLSMQQLGQVFRAYYQRGIAFHECNRGGPTFLFRQVYSKNDLEDMKRKEGYV